MHFFLAVVYLHRIFLDLDHSMLQIVNSSLSLKLQGWLGYVTLTNEILKSSQG